MYSTVVWEIYLTESEDFKHRVGGDCRDRLLGSVQTIVGDCKDVGAWNFPNGFGDSTHQGCKHWWVQILAAGSLRTATTGGSRVYIQAVWTVPTGGYTKQGIKLLNEVIVHRGGWGIFPLCWWRRYLLSIWVL
jgi:hypothetical protein